MKRSQRQQIFLKSSYNRAFKTFQGLTFNRFKISEPAYLYLAYYVLPLIPEGRTARLDLHLL